MFVRGIIIAQWGPYSLTSYGRGTAYTLRHRDSEVSHSVVFQGDDAATFREELEAEECSHPDVSALPTLWDRYAHVAEPD